MKVQVTMELEMSRHDQQELKMELWEFSKQLFAHGVAIVNYAEARSIEEASEPSSEGLSRNTGNTA